VRRAGPSSRGVLPTVVCLICVIMKPRRNEEAQAHIRLSSHKKNPEDQKLTPGNNPKSFKQHYDHGGSLQLHYTAGHALECVTIIHLLPTQMVL
jgi:hypothetical protein